MIEIKDFSFSVEPKRFRINDDIFEAVPEMPLHLMSMAARLTSQNIASQGVEIILELFDELLVPTAAARFRERVNDKIQPIGMRHINAILPWLMEVYGLRPTEPSADSSSTPDGTGMSSTHGVSSEASTQFNLVPLDS